MSTFHEVRFPTDVSFGSSGGATFKTQVFETYRGYEYRNSDWSQPMMSFDVSYGIKTDDQMQEVLAFFNARQGRIHGFRYKNWSNFQIIEAPIAAGNGVDTRLPLVQISGDYQARHYRRLRKIVRGSVRNVSAGGEVLREGEDFNIDYDSGEIVTNIPVAYGIPINCENLEFDEPVRFEDDSLQSVIDGWNNNSLGRLALVGLRENFVSGSVFSPATPANVSEPFYFHTAFALNFDDISDGLTSSVDDSANKHAVTLFGTAILDPTEFKHGEASLNPGVGGFASITGEFINLAGQDMTLEVFAKYPADGDRYQTIVGQWNDVADQRVFLLRYDAVREQLDFFVSGDGIDRRLVLSCPWEFSGESYFDYIVVNRESGGLWSIRLNGEIQNTNLDRDPIHTAPDIAVEIGGASGPEIDTGPYRANIDSVRLTVGRSRFTGNDLVPIPTTTV